MFGSCFHVSIPKPQFPAPTCNGYSQSHKLRYAFVQVWVARENRTPFAKGWEGGVPLPLCVCTHCVHSARAGAEQGRAVDTSSSLPQAVLVPECWVPSLR